MRVKLARSFVSFWTSNGHLLIALHLRWRFAITRPQGKPGYVRFYFGPIEVEHFSKSRKV